MDVSFQCCFIFIEFPNHRGTLPFDACHGRQACACAQACMHVYKPACMCVLVSLHGCLRVVCMWMWDQGFLCASVLYAHMNGCVHVSVACVKTRMCMPVCLCVQVCACPRVQMSMCMHALLLSGSAPAGEHHDNV